MLSFLLSLYMQVVFGGSAGPTQGPQTDTVRCPQIDPRCPRVPTPDDGVM